ncbi:hypothetical protein SDC9_209685 [bioreactor metagenome]|uniref:Uncharacterized protein n=1 Tax=bioreactor metagenome TaxID=1076179 RepID=A0A645JGW9_9ZZZZ
MAVNGNQYVALDGNTFHAACRTRLAQVSIDVFRDSLYRQFAQGGEIRWREECLQRLCSLFRQVHLSMVQTFY